jgi:TDG/mug DNA glycosylase family protein
VAAALAFIPSAISQQLCALQDMTPPSVRGLGRHQRDRGRVALTVERTDALPDVLPGPGDPPLRVLFCGINPGLLSAAKGQHFARPGNRFWPALHRSGFTPTQLHPDQQFELPTLGLGITNLVSRATARAQELSRLELRDGGIRLATLVDAVTPSWVAVVGITAYRAAFDEPNAVIGPQHRRLGDAQVWVLPNPSGLNAHWPLPAMAEEFARLRNVAK